MALIILPVLVAVSVTLWRYHRAAPSAVDVAWLVGPAFAEPAAPDRQQALAVCRRYLTRHVRHRWVGALVGVLFGLVVGVRWYSSVSIGFGQGNPMADLLFCGLTGLIVGALSAESFRIGADGSQRVAASLVPREPWVGIERVVAARLIAVASLVLAVVAGATDHGWFALTALSILVVPFAVAELVRRAIDDRSRPVMSDRAHLLDARFRSFAASSVSFLHVAIATLMLGWTISKIEGLTGVFSVVQMVVVLGCLAVTVAMLRRAAPRQPKSDRVRPHNGDVAVAEEPVSRA